MGKGKHIDHQEHIKKRLNLTKNVTLLLGAVWAASMFLLLDTLSKLSGSASPMTGFLVSDTAAVGAGLPGPSWFSAGIYFLGLVIFGGAIFAVSRHSQELRTMLKLERKERIITGTPKQALIDFFTILSTWSIKNTASDVVLEEMEDIRESEKSDIHALSMVSFNLSGEDEIEVKVAGNPEWDEVGKIFETYLTALSIEKSKVINIADYLGKDDVGTILSQLEIDEPKADALSEKDLVKSRQGHRKSKSRLAKPKAKPANAKRSKR